MSSALLILASNSPRRLALLRQAGFEFSVEPSDVDEDAMTASGMLPSALAVRLAEAKASVVAERFPDNVILAADTVVAFGDQVLSKPADADDAHRMLSLLAGTTHVVITGVCVAMKQHGCVNSARVMSAVRMRTLSTDEIAQYVAGGQWQGKAGGYGIQDQDPFVTRLSGCHTNIVGLPMTTTIKMLADVGIEPAE